MLNSGIMAGPTISNSSASFGSKLGDSLDNLLTGQRDYDRTVSLQDRANAFSATESQKARVWSEKMSNTAYQRAVADMKAAGLNPALLYSSGGVASTPASSAAHGSGASAPNSAAPLTHLIGTIGSLLLGAVRLGNSAAAVRNRRQGYESIYVDKDGAIRGSKSTTYF